MTGTESDRATTRAGMQATSIELATLGVGISQSKAEITALRALFADMLEQK